MIRYGPPRSPTTTAAATTTGLASRVPAATETDRLSNLLTISEALNHVKDLDSLLDRILHEARTITSADAGTIFLVEGDKLRFSYTQNDTLFAGDVNHHRFVYVNAELPIDDRSLAGYVAVSGQPMIIDDGYDLPADVPFNINRSFDQKTGYRSVSYLVVPLKTSLNKLVGVMQIINALDPRSGQPVPFTETDRLYVSLFANSATVAIDRAQMTRAIILRMIKMAELRDPLETGAHVDRVAAYTIEIYQRWAMDHQVAEQEIKRQRDLLRIAAMLHDVGKVSIPDAILTKNGELTEAERALMETHCVIGARLFQDSKSDWDLLSAEIALNHHERWDGSGYPGRVDNLSAEPVRYGPPKRGAEIPISARIVGLADVYDALVSRRAYKGPWREPRVLDYIRRQSGRQFDPEVVDAFLEVYPVIKAIRAKYTE